ncbi:hypothetical protein [Salinicola tamaricis]|uniref:hypothetical protein n=1 Tax=Salinicola tamaricis TaxID=1771309 RepID=UPI0030F42B2F
MATEKAAMEEFKSLFQQELDRGHGKTGDGEHAANDSEEDPMTQTLAQRLAELDDAFRGDLTPLSGGDSGAGVWRWRRRRR